MRLSFYGALGPIRSFVESKAEQLKSYERSLDVDEITQIVPTYSSLLGHISFCSGRILVFFLRYPRIPRTEKPQNENHFEVFFG